MDLFDQTDALNTQITIASSGVNCNLDVYNLQDWFGGIKNDLYVVSAFGCAVTSGLDLKIAFGCLSAMKNQFFDQ